MKKYTCLHIWVKVHDDLVNGALMLKLNDNKLSSKTSNSAPVEHAVFILAF